MKNRLIILGVMTGTSCDGIDAACIEIPIGSGDQLRTQKKSERGCEWIPLWSSSRPYRSDLKERVLALQEPGSRHSTKAILELDRDLGEWYGRTLHSIIQSRHRKFPIPDLIANHGQSVSHFPTNGVTLQLGDPSRIAYKTGISVASHFREGDLAAGGQGAPLLPIFHHLILRKIAPKGGDAIHNLGGISNLTYLGEKGWALGYDTGPGNLWIDAAMEIATQGKKHFDRNGLTAASGSINCPLLSRLLEHPYFLKPAPKATGRDEFPVSYFTHLAQRFKVRGPDLVTTATELTAESIGKSYKREILDRRLPLHQIFLCGGGSKNKTLLARIQYHLPQTKVRTLEEVGLKSQDIEAQGFAYLGFLTLTGRALGGPWTGASKNAPPGQLTPGLNWEKLLKKLTHGTYRL